MREYQILLVEDDSVDIMTIERAFRQANIANPIFKARDGLAALEHLRGSGGKEQIDRPLLILLDLNMPLMNGLEFLETIKNDLELRDIPVVVLTSSQDEEDIAEAYDGQVAGYMTKPIEVERLIAKLTALGRYWTLCEMP